MNNIDISKEHEICHTSEDWENLQDKCPECFKCLKRLGRYNVDIELEKERLGKCLFHWKTEDDIISPNPLK